MRILVFGLLLSGSFNVFAMQGHTKSTRQVFTKKRKEKVQKRGTKELREMKYATLTLPLLQFYQEIQKVMPNTIRDWPSERKEEARALIEEEGLEELYDLEVWPLQKMTEKGVEFVSKYEYDAVQQTSNGLAIRKYLQQAKKEPSSLKKLSQEQLAKCQLFAVKSRNAAWLDLPLWPIHIGNTNGSSLDMGSIILVDHLNKRAFDALREDSEAITQEVQKIAHLPDVDKERLIFSDEQVEVVKRALHFFQAYVAPTPIDNTELEKDFSRLSPQEAIALFSFSSRYKFKELREYVLWKQWALLIKENPATILPQVLRLNYNRVKNIHDALATEESIARFFSENLQEFLKKIPKEKRRIPIVKTSLTTDKLRQWLGIKVDVRGAHALVVQDKKERLRYFDLHTKEWRLIEQGEENYSSFENAIDSSKASRAEASGTAAFTVNRQSFQLRRVYDESKKEAEFCLSRGASKKPAKYTALELLMCWCGLNLNKTKLLNIRPYKDRVHPILFEKLACDTRVMTGYGPRDMWRSVHNSSLSSMEKLKIAAPTIGAATVGMAACAGIGYLAYNHYTKN
jgi:hypothetical protein